MSINDPKMAVKELYDQLNEAKNSDEFNHPNNICNNCKIPHEFTHTKGTLEDICSLMDRRLSSPGNRIYFEIGECGSGKHAGHRCIEMKIWHGRQQHIEYFTRYKFCRSGDIFFACGPKDWDVKMGKTT